MNRQYALILFVMGLSLGACSHLSDTASTSISGEIVNPSDSLVTISKDDRIVDTVLLDKKNHFHYNFDRVDEGLYTFQHGDETQMFYLKEGDSLRLHLNNNDFDATLMYSGNGAKANNFLMYLFLDNQKNNKIFLTYYNYGPQKFFKKIDSIRSESLARLDDLDLETGPEDGFKNMAERIIDYSNYDMRERYLFLTGKYNREMIEKLPSEFLAYREKIDFNDKALQTYYAYQRFLNNYIKNEAVKNCLSGQEGSNCYNLQSKANLKRRLYLADSLFDLKSLRTRYIGRFAAARIVHSQEDGKVDSTISFLEDVDYNRNKLQQFKHLSKIQKRQFIGNIDQLDLLPPSEDETSIASILTAPTVFFYWSLHYKAHHENLHRKISQLRERYPEINFVGINIDNDDYKSWKSSLKNFGYSSDHEYQLVCAPEERGFYRNYLNKLVFVNKSGEIVDSNLNAQDSRLGDKLADLLKE